jgi:hypothetical protein
MWASPYGIMTVEDQMLLAKALDLPYVHHQGAQVAASTEHWAEYLDRAEGREPQVYGKVYWD